MKPFLLLAITAIFALSLHPLEAAAKKGSKPKPTPAPKKIDASTTSKITKVGGDSITIECSDKSTTYKIGKATEISVDGRRAPASDLKAGMHVMISESLLHPGELTSIQATSTGKS